MKVLSSSFKIWIDLENTPHVPFFLPIVRALRKQGHEVSITARDCYQTCQMADFKSLDYKRIGRHYGRHLIFKILGVISRGLQLLPHAFKTKPDLVLNLGSRSQNLAAKIMGIPVVEIMDYEHTAETPLLLSRWYLIPDVVSRDRYEEHSPKRVFPYHGLKEDVYVTGFKPDDAILDQLELRLSKAVVTVRPAAGDAHYHNHESDDLFVHLINRIIATPDIKAVLLPRNTAQEKHLRASYPQWFDSSKVVIPNTIVDGLNLIWHSDLVVSGGGTMNRESAAMGVPVYSIFRGRIGAVDRWLCDHNRLVLIESAADADSKIRLEPRTRHRHDEATESRAFADIISHLNAIIDSLRKISFEPIN